MLTAAIKLWYRWICLSAARPAPAARIGYAAFTARINHEKCRILFDFNDGQIYYGENNTLALIPSSSFSFDTWFTVRMIVDTINDTFDLYINDALYDNIDAVTNSGTPLLRFSLRDDTDNSTDALTWCFDNITVTDQTYAVTYNSNGGSGVAATADVIYGSTIAAPTAPTFSGYTFEGWYKDAGLTELWDFSSDTVTNDVTLYAKWLSTYEINIYYIDEDTGVQLQTLYTVLGRSGKQHL